MSNKNNNQQKRNKNHKHRNRNFSPGKKKKSNYEKITEFLINNIKKEFAYRNNKAEPIQNTKYADSSTWYPR